jgi:CxxC motif-containing protein (DUF1111 family)
MKSIYFLPALLIATITGLIVACKHNTNADGQTISKDSLIKRGNYLVTTMGCNDCHSPKVMTGLGARIGYKPSFIRTPG